jgi:hypothetical protein
MNEIQTMLNAVDNLNSYTFKEIKSILTEIYSRHLDNKQLTDFFDSILQKSVDTQDKRALSFLINYFMRN